MWALSGFLNGNGLPQWARSNTEATKERPELGRFRGSEDCGELRRAPQFFA